MTAQKGSLVLIKVGDSATPVESFNTIRGLKVSRMLIENQTIDASDVSSGAWRKINSGAGRSLVISGTGIFSDVASEEVVRGYAFSGVAKNYRFYFGNGSYVAGAFVISRYERSGEYDEEETYGLTLESAGGISFTQA